METLTIRQRRALDEILDKHLLYKAIRRVARKTDALDVADENVITLMALSVWDAQMEAADCEEAVDCVLTAHRRVRRELGYKADSADNATNDAVLLVMATATLCCTLQGGTLGTMLASALVSEMSGYGHNRGFALMYELDHALDEEHDQFEHWLWHSVVERRRLSVEIENLIYSMSNNEIQNEMIKALADLVAKSMERPTYNVEGDMYKFEPGSQQINHYYNGKRDMDLNPSEERLKEVIEQLLNEVDADGKRLMSASTCWYAVCKVMVEVYGMASDIRGASVILVNMGMDKADPPCVYNNFKNVGSRVSGAATKVETWHNMKAGATGAMLTQILVATRMMELLKV